MNLLVKTAFSRVGLICVAAWWSNVVATAGPLELVDPSGLWQETLVQRPLAAGINCEFAVTQPNRRERLLVMSSVPGTDEVESLSVFAQRLGNIVSASAIGSFSENPTAVMGFEGVELHFEVSDAGHRFICALFVFADGGQKWGVLHAVPVEEAATALQRYEILHKARPGSSEPVVLGPFRVKSVPVTGFPVSLQINHDRSTRRVTAVVISEVTDLGAKEYPELRAGDTVIRIDRRNVAEFSDGIGADTELGRIFLNRKLGDVVELDLLEANTKKPYSVRLRCFAPRLIDQVFPLSR